MVFVVVIPLVSVWFWFLIFLKMASLVQLHSPNGMVQLYPPNDQYTVQPYPPNGHYITQPYSPNGQYMLQLYSPNGQYMVQLHSPNSQYMVQSYRES